MMRKRTRLGGPALNTSEFCARDHVSREGTACHATNHLPLSAGYKRRRAVTLAAFSNQNGNKFEDSYEISLCLKVSGGVNQT
jgi:hypothetical protein